MLQIGSVIDGKYKILNVIGRGGMSTVYLAINERANKPWAVKEVRRRDFRELQVDKKEIEMMKKLRHPGLPAIVDVIEERDALLIVMDYVEGRSLEDLLEEYGAQPEERVLAWAKQLCDVLDYLHRQSPPIIYRDMKPANVMLKPDGTVTLIDFGAAREYREERGKDTVCLGTRGYAAPEQYELAGQSDMRTDIYCLGVTLFQLLTGESPHQLRPVRECDPGLSAGLEAVLEKCTRVKKEERYRSCRELSYALAHYWEQDAAYVKRQKNKLLTFLTPMWAAVLLGLLAGIFKGLERQTQKNTYEAYLLAAGNAATKEEELDNYQKAISLNPYEEEAYLGLLQNGFLDDEVLTREESEALRAVLIQYGDRAVTNETAFRKNEEGYAGFAYQAGIAYFYKFEEKENKKKARGYFEIAAASEDLEEQQVRRARCLFVISDYYSKIGLSDAAGDFTVTYETYWEDLVEASAGNLVEADNERTALVMYEELISQMVSRAAEFQKAGVSREEMLSQLEGVKKHLETDFQNLPEGSRETILTEIRELEDFIRTAERTIASAYGQEKEGH